MTLNKSLVAAGLLLLGVASAHSAATVKLLTTGAKQGQKASVVLWGTPDKAGATYIQSAVVIIDFDTAAAAASTTASDFVAGPGWTMTDFNGAYGAGQVSATLANNSTTTDGQTGQENPGPIITINLTKSNAAATTIHLDPASSFGDNNFGLIPFSTDAVSVLNGPVRQLGAAITGSPSVGFGGTVAVVAGGKLQVLNSADLSDLAGFTTPTLTAGLSPISRPTFGVVGGANVIAVGENDGTVALFNAATGAAVGAPVSIGTANASAPAIDSATGDVFAAANTAGPAALARIAGGAATPVSLTGTAVTGSPAFLSGTGVIAVGTNAGLETLRWSGTAFTPQTSPTQPADNAPVYSGTNGVAMYTSGNNVYLVNSATNAVLGSSAVTGVTKFSEGWYDAATGTWYFGGSDGKVYGFTAGASGPVAGTTTAVATAPLVQPLVLGTTVYAADNTGNFKAGANTAVNVGGPTTPALAATGRGATDSVIVAENGGGVAALPL